MSHTQVLDKTRNSKTIYVPERNYQSINYTVSGGYLLLPKEYTDYKQLNVNLYTEFIGQQTLDRRTWFIDMAPALQLIFNSNTKLNLGYRFQLDGNMARMADQSFLVSLERTFLNALKKKINGDTCQEYGLRPLYQSCNGDHATGGGRYKIG